jgi:hypothetical protein
MDINEKLDRCHRIYMNKAVAEAKSLMKELAAFVENPASVDNVVRIELGYRDFIRSKNIADAWEAHKEIA